MARRIRARLARVHPRLEQVRIAFGRDAVTNRAGKRGWFVDDGRKQMPGPRV